MLINYNRETMIFITITQVIFKSCLLWLGTITLVQNIDKEVFEFLISGTPSTIAQYLGFLYLVFIVARKGIETWTTWQINKIKVREEKIKCDLMKKELDKDK